MQGICIYSVFVYDYDAPSSSLSNSPVLDLVSQINPFFPNLLFECFIVAIEMKLEQSFYYGGIVSFLPITHTPPSLYGSLIMSHASQIMFTFSATRVSCIHGLWLLFNPPFLSC